MHVFRKHNKNNYILSIVELQLYGQKKDYYIDTNNESYFNTLIRKIILPRLLQNVQINTTRNGAKSNHGVFGMKWNAIYITYKTEHNKYLV
jgi:hypothetical protein